MAIGGGCGGERGYLVVGASTEGVLGDLMCVQRC